MALRFSHLLFSVLCLCLWLSLFPGFFNFRVRWKQPEGIIVTNSLISNHLLASRRRVLAGRLDFTPFLKHHRQNRRLPDVRPEKRLLRERWIPVTPWRSALSPLVQTPCTIDDGHSCDETGNQKGMISTGSKASHSPKPKCTDNSLLALSKTATHE